MTDDGTPEGAQFQPEPPPPDPPTSDPPPISPGGPWQTGTRVEQLATWIEAIRPGFTDAAIERSAVAGGFTAEEFREALVLAEASQHRGEAMAPIRSKAKRIILAAYGIVWLLFAIPYLVRPTTYGAGPIEQGILTISLTIGLVISAVVMRALHPDPARVGRALVILLVVPVIVLLVIGGLCLPFVPSTSIV
jgi:hypothetical protein